MRLGSYIALELAAGAIALGGVVGGAIAVVSVVAPRLDPAADPSAQLIASAQVAKAPDLPSAAAPRPVAAPAVAVAAAVVATASPAPPEPGAPPPGAAVAPASVAALAVDPAAKVPATAPAPIGASPTALAMSTGTASPSAELPAPTKGPVPASLSSRASVYGAPDAQLLAPLRGSPVVGCKANRGGTSLSLRLEFQSGARAAFKPEQIHPQSQPRREIAAFLIDRMLGIGRVPPATAITVTMEELSAAIAPASRGELSTRLRAEARPRRGVLHGVASWWIPEIKVAAIGKHPIDSTDGIVTWKRYLAIGSTPPADVADLVAQISDMVLFDFLIDNSDRWSGGNARTSPDGRVLYFMDNTLSFTRNKQAHTRTSTYLHRVQVFSRRLVEKVRSFTREDLVATLAATDDGGLGPLLINEEIDALMQRRAHAVEYLDGLLAEYGADRVLAFP